MAGVTEAEFYKQLEWLIEETTAAMAVYDVYEEVHKLALERNDLHTAMLPRVGGTGSNDVGALSRPRDVERVAGKRVKQY